jgi:amino acid adenylation domain-containing protein
MVSLYASEQLSWDFRFYTNGSKYCFIPRPGVLVRFSTVEETTLMERSTAECHPVTEQVAEFAKKYPQSIALEFEGRQLSYEELDRGADRFAGHLLELGIVPGEAVAICMERSFDWIVAALGILRSGAAYVPLDPAWPDSRLRFAVEDSRAAVLVARATLLDRLQVKVHGLDPCRNSRSIAAAPLIKRQDLPAQSLAYVIYTSGSTGVPKGVEITHANLAYLIQWHLDAFRITLQDRTSHLAGLGFDAAVWEIWPNLCAGATLCLADDAVRSSPQLMHDWMIQQRITVAFVPTVHATPLTAMEWPAATSLRLMLTGGDALHHAPLNQLPFDVVNNYGPTECTVVATSCVVKPGTVGAPPIGRAIAGARVYILNEDGKPVADGSIGEIFVGGAGVGRGYRNLPGLTEQNFRPDPFSAEPGSRMYRTGDRGCRRPDGEIEFQGRIDRQTKIRGQRIELDEISSVLSSHPSLEFAAAMAEASDDGENKLVAYVLPKFDAPVPTAKELQSHLQRSLPSFMIPADFVRLRVLPLSPNGKVDLNLLAHTSDSRLLEAEPAKAPATPTEEKLLIIIRRILENNDVAVDDNIFLVGGDSLFGMQVVIQLRAEFGVEVTLQQLFQAPTVERLAALIETRRREQRLAVIWSELLGRNHFKPNDRFADLGGNAELTVALQNRIGAEFGQRVPIAELLRNPTLKQQAELTNGLEKRPLALPPGVIALEPYESRNSIFWVHYLSANLAKAVGVDWQFLFVGLAAVDLPPLGPAPNLQSIAACLVDKILATQSEGPYTIGGLCLGGVLAYEIASQLRAARHDVSLLVLLDPPSPSLLDSRNPLTPKLSNPGYLLKRLASLGLRLTLDKIRGHLIEHFPRSIKAKLKKPETSVGQRIVEAAASSYRPAKYEGRVLLLLADDHPPHVDFLPGWQAIVPHTLHTEYVHAHHSELTKTQNVGKVADAIVSHIDCTCVRQACS